jgi:hypothetical protein
MKLKYAVFILLFALAPVLAAMPDLAGNWTGESICMIKDSPCHDEKVIYHVTEPNAMGDLKIQADKIVNGQPEDMGTLDCKFDKKASTVTCPMKQGEWKFSVKDDTMIGTLTLPDGRLYRKISLRKDKE